MLTQLSGSCCCCCVAAGTCHPAGSVQNVAQPPLVSWPVPVSSAGFAPGNIGTNSLCLCCVLRVSVSVVFTSRVLPVTDVNHCTGTCHLTVLMDALVRHRPLLHIFHAVVTSSELCLCVCMCACPADCECNTAGTLSRVAECAQVRP